MIKKIWLFFLIFSISLLSYAQTDREFWFVAPDVNDAGQNYDRSIVFRITSASAAATVTISQPANSSFTPIVTNVAAGSTVTVNVTVWINLIENSPANLALNKGILIRSTADITVYYEVVSEFCNCNPELFSLKGKNAIGNEFFISAQYRYNIDSVPHPNATSSFEIVATEDNTVVTITPSKPIVGHAANVPFTITLNRGQTYSAVALYKAGAAHLHGSYVTATKPIAITLKDDLVRGVGVCGDLMGDQTIPTSVLGTEYIVTKGMLVPNDHVFVMAADDNVSVYVDGSATPAQVLAKGQSFMIDLTNNSSYIRADKKVYVYQATGNGCELGSAIIPKLNCTGSNSISIVRSNNDPFVVMITVRAGAQGSFTVNGNAAAITAAQFTAVPGTGGAYVTARIDVSAYASVGSVVNIRNNTGKFSMGVFQGSTTGGNRYGFFSDFKSSTVQKSQFDICRGDSIQLNALGGVSYQWSPSAGLSNPAIPNPKASPSATTEYKVLITDADGCVDSAIVKVNVTNCRNPVAGIVNLYTPALGFDPCKNSVTVGDATGYQVGDTVLLIQMKGALIDSTNTAGFGTVLNYRNAGNYEYNYISGITGNNIELKNVLTRPYNMPDGKVQLIRVPWFESISVTNTLTCKPWDGTTGGVLVFNVKDTLTLNSNIDVSKKGFSGGKAVNTRILSSNCFTNDYYYPNGSVVAAPKGESIANISNNISSGKGAAASGGGGGLDHNSGGGGGGNGTVGGLGGYQLYECNSTYFDNRGIGGRALTYSNAQNRIYMGGGGGAGHCNNDAGNAGLSNFSGGNGGALVLISANYVDGNNFSIHAQGDTAYEYHYNGGSAHDGIGGGGAGGTVLFSVNNYISPVTINVRGGKGGDMWSSLIGGHIGPGGGGAGGVVWFNQNAVPAAVNIVNNGGIGGILIESGDKHGTMPGSSGINLFGLQMPIDVIPFKKNIDSVRIKDTLTNCNVFDFKALAYTNTSGITAWSWEFGDGGTATVQDVQHTYNNTGSYPVTLIGTDITGCKDTVVKTVTINGLAYDFTYKQDICNPYAVSFTAAGANITGPSWSFGDGNTNTASTTPSNIYSANGDYLVTFTVQQNGCIDTVRKLIPVHLLKDDIIITPDTTICAGTTKQLRTKPALSFCWSPVTWLNDPALPNPVTSAPQDITYYFTALTTGANLIANGDFAQGVTGFTSEYQPAASGLPEGVYSVGADPVAWHPGFSACRDHTTGTGNMMLVNGSSRSNVKVWSQTISVQPNTSYAFSAWLQSLSAAGNPPLLEFSINGMLTGNALQGTAATCNWNQFYTVWNSGNNTTATISIVNMNQVLLGNDFALDDISFAPIISKRDSVVIKVENPVVKTSGDTTVCTNKPVPLQTTGAVTYSWSPAGLLSNSAIANPVATVTAPTEFIVTGTTANGCTAKDTVLVSTFVKPLITITGDTAICYHTPAPLSVSGGIQYLWAPAATLSNAGISNPVALPDTTTTYTVQVTDVNNCTYADSVTVSHIPIPRFTASASQPVCLGSSITLHARGGDNYTWSPASWLDDVSAPDPVATPTVTTQYTVHISENVCGYDSTINMTITVNPVPDVQAQKSTDVDCTITSAQLSATGANRYVWTPAPSLFGEANIANPVTNIDTTTMFTVQGFNSYGCSDIDSVLVKVTSTNMPVFAVPNAFTPNGDGKNDCFGIRRWGRVKLDEFAVFNRWGQKIFSTRDPGTCWDGTFNGLMQNSGGYVYVITGRGFCGPIKRTGMVMLIR